MNRPASILLLMITAAAGLSCGPGALRRFAARPTLWQDDDRRDLAQPPAPRRRAEAATLLANQVVAPLDRLLAIPVSRRARNVNALDEVPDSSWFVNRERRGPLTPARVRQGAARGEGPSLLASWQVRWASQGPAGLTLGIRDERGQGYRLRFDAPGHPRLATAATLVASRLLFALGYHLPGRHLVLFTADQLALAKSARVRRSDGQARPGDPPYTDRHLRRALARLPRLADGSLRAVATRLTDCKPLGAFAWQGRRRDDPNDFVDHQRRRELRGLGLIAAWLNLSGITREVGATCYRSTAKPRYVVHQLAELRGALGSTVSGQPKALWEGFAARFSARRTLASALSLGVATPAWLGLGPRRRQLLKRWPGLGWLSAERFSPKAFRPRLDNAAFGAADDGDRFWAARRLAALGPALIGAAVQVALLPPAESKRLRQVLLLRRQKILARALRLHAPLSRLRWEQADQRPGTARLCFRDLWRQAGFDGPKPARYRWRLRGARGQVVIPPRDITHRAAGAQICLPLGLTGPAWQHAAGDDGYRVLELWRPALSPRRLGVHLRRVQERYVIAGLHR